MHIFLMLVGLAIGLDVPQDCQDCSNTFPSHEAMSLQQLSSEAMYELVIANYPDDMVLPYGVRLDASCRTAENRHLPDHLVQSLRLIEGQTVRCEKAFGVEFLPFTENVSSMQELLSRVVINCAQVRGKFGTPAAAETFTGIVLSQDGEPRLLNHYGFFRRSRRFAASALPHVPLVINLHQDKDSYSEKDPHVTASYLFHELLHHLPTNNQINHRDPFLTLVGNCSGYNIEDRVYFLHFSCFPNSSGKFWELTQRCTEKCRKMTKGYPTVASWISTLEAPPRQLRDHYYAKDWPVEKAQKFCDRHQRYSSVMSEYAQWNDKAFDLLKEVLKFNIKLGESESPKLEAENLLSIDSTEPNSYRKSRDRIAQYLGALRGNDPHGCNNIRDTSLRVKCANLSSQIIALARRQKDWLDRLEKEYPDFLALLQAQDPI